MDFFKNYRSPFFNMFLRNYSALTIVKQILYSKYCINYKLDSIPLIFYIKLGN